MKLFLTSIILLWTSVYANPTRRHDSNEVLCDHPPLDNIPADSTYLDSLSSLLSTSLNRLVDLGYSSSLRQGEFAILSQCTKCHMALSLGEFLYGLHRSPAYIPTVIETVCNRFHIETRDVCHGIVTEFRDEFITVLTNLTMSPSDVCAVVYGCGNVKDQHFNWTVTVPPKSSGQDLQPWPRRQAGSPLLKVLQISDVHVDPNYGAGSDAQCGKPLCCQQGSEPKSASAAAGRWGDYRSCDTPMATFELLMAQIANNHRDLDYILWTGDVGAHNVWNQTRQTQIDVIRAVSGSLKKYFPGIPIYPALGNHESNPVNSFPPPQVTGKDSMSWLYEEIYHDWADWLPAEAMGNIRKGAYYSVNITDGLKLISLNMNYCNNFNWWLLLDNLTQDPADELAWLVRELSTAEAAGQLVHIIGHIPPGGDDCIAVWSANYYKIVNRFHRTVIAQFFGHTHQDQFQMFFEDQPVQRAGAPRVVPTAVAYVGPSITTYGGVNPGYRVYKIDGNHSESTYQVVDYDNWYVNLEEANLGRLPPYFRHAYSASRDLGVKPLSPDQWLQFLKRIEHNSTEFERYYAYQPSLSEFWLSENVCEDDICRRKLICDRLKGRSHDESVCAQFPHNL